MGSGRAPVGVDEAVLGIEVGGTTMAAGVVGPDGHLLSVARVAIAAADSAEDLWQALMTAGDQALAAAGVARVVGIGCGCAGPMQWPHGVVSPLNLPQWREFPLAARIHEKWPLGPTRVHNDAVCLAVAEHWVGAARGSANALGLVVSTGVGGGLILGNRVINGGLGNAGHIGHVVVDPDGPPCACGGRGCLEAIARGPAIVAWAQQQGWSPPTGHRADDVGLLMSATEGNPVAVDAFRRCGEAIGQVLASAAALLDLDVAAIGGGLMNAGELLVGPLHDSFDRHAGFGFVRRLQIVPASCGQEAGIVGAAGLVAGGPRYWTAEQ